MIGWLGSLGLCILASLMFSFIPLPQFLVYLCGPETMDLLGHGRDP